jgi:uncharacterized protein YjbI with pentapeptide repeats
LQASRMLQTRFDILVVNNTVLNTYLDGADVRSGQLGSSHLAGASLTGTDLTGADFSNGGAGPVIFSTTVTVNGQSIALQPELSGANLSGTNFQGANLASMNFEQAKLNNSNLRFADLRQANLTQANLTKADLRSAKLESAILNQANLSNANLTSADLTKATLAPIFLKDVTFVTSSPIHFPPDASYSDFLAILLTQDCPDGTFLISSNGELVPFNAGAFNDLGRSFYNSGRWQDAVYYICAATMRGVQTRGSLGSNYLAGVDMSGADLSSTDLSKTVLEDTIQVDDLTYKLVVNLKGVSYNSFTVWPVTFVPPKPSIPQNR